MPGLSDFRFFLVSIEFCLRLLGAARGFSGFLGFARGCSGLMLLFVMYWSTVVIVHSVVIVSNNATPSNPEQPWVTPGKPQVTPSKPQAWVARGCLGVQPWATPGVSSHPRLLDATFVFPPRYFGDRGKMTCFFFSFSFFSNGLCP